MSSRKPALPGVQRDVDALLGSEPLPGEVPRGPANDATAVEARAETAMPSPVVVPSEAKPFNGAHAAVTRDIDPAALIELASQFPSAGATARALDPAPAVASGETTAAALDAPIAAAGATASASATFGQRSDGDRPGGGDRADKPRSAVAGAARGEDPMRRWAVLAGIVLLGLALVVLLDAVFFSGAKEPVAQVPGSAPATATDEREFLRSRLTDAQGRLDAIEAAQRETVRSIAALRDQMTARIAGAASEADLGVTRLALVAARIDTLATTGRPFPAELAAARAATASNADLRAVVARLEPFAETPVPTRRDLTVRISAKAPRIAALPGDPTSEGIFDWVGGVFSRRPSQEQITVAILSRTQSELEAGDLAAAVRQLQRLPGAQRHATLPWIAAAERRLALDVAVNDLNAGVFRMMAKTP